LIFKKLIPTKPHFRSNYALQKPVSTSYNGLTSEFKHFMLDRFITHKNLDN